MKYSKALSIIKNLEKHNGHEIINMPTINAVNKDDLRNVIKYLFDMLYEVKTDEKDGESNV